MYKMLIVDDEQMIRNGMRSMIPWAAIGIGEVFTAASGKAALEVVRQEKPEIMITDLCMPDMDGLALIEELNRLNSEMRILVLTGYDNFEYVQKCCKMHVQDFLLKPTDEQELTAAIIKQIEALDERQHKKAKSRALGLSEQIKLEHSMKLLLHNEIELSRLDSLFEEYGYQKEQPMQVAVCVPVLDIDQSWKNHNALLKLSVKNIAIEMFDSNYEAVTFEDRDGNIVIAFFENELFDEVLERVEKLKSRLLNEFRIQQKIVLGSRVSGFGKMSISYNDAIHLLHENQGSVFDVIQAQQSENRLKLFSDILDELKKIMVNNIGNMDMLIKALDTFEKMTKSYNLSLSYVRRSCFDIAATLYYAYISDTRENVDNRLGSFLSALLVCGKDEVFSLLQGFAAKLFNQEETGTHEMIFKAKRYIGEHLTEELSVSQIAAQLFITPNYFSRLFKKVAGEGCNEYMVRKRMQQAQSLLETTNIRTGRIAQLVGYGDINYFSLAFKKSTGMSPREYRESHQKSV